MAFQMFFQRQNRLQRKDRIFRDRTHPLDIYDDQELMRRYRMPRQSILRLIDLLHDDLQPPTNRSKSIPASLQVITALRYYATGSFQQVIADVAGLSQPSVSRIISVTSKALAQRVGNFIKFPQTQQEQFAVKNGFAAEFNMPNTLGCVDGTFIPIKPPSVREEAYVCRKSFHALNIQGICDHQKKLTNIVVRWPGSTHDAYMWNNCALKTWLETQPYIGHILGDSAYPLKQYLLTPIRDPRTPAERAYNTSHKRTRQRIEDTFGRWKSRWMCIHKYGGPLTVSLLTAIDVITATAILHNICEELGLPGDIEEEEQEEGDDDNDLNQNNNQDRDGQHMRQMLIRERF